MIKNGNRKERFLIFLIVNLFLFFVIFASINNSSSCSILSMSLFPKRSINVFLDNVSDIY